MNPNPDLYDLFGDLRPDQRERWQRLRAFLEAEVRPIADEAWLEGRFPRHLIARFADLAEPVLHPGGFCWPPADPLFMGLVKLELGRVDPSLASFFGVHYGLAAASVALLGSDAQRAAWLPPLASFQKIGSFALSEPEVGSDAAQGLRCLAEPVDGGWALTGQKKWSGNAPFADVLVIIARGPAPGQTLGFLVEPGQPGLRLEPLGGKIAKRAVENVVITLDRCWVPESARLTGLHHFRDVARALAVGRYAVAWEATGVALGAYEAAHRYVLERQQFGRPLASFQLVQDKLVRMMAELTSMLAVCFRLAEVVARDGFDAARPALAKVICAGGMRRVVALARELLGGNGILLEHGVARLFADAEAIYSYEGTQDMNTLIVGRHLTGIAAFT
jgi:glutaryl-CoA dehydrogenase